MNNFLLKHSQFSSASFLKTATKMLALFVLVFWSVPGMGQIVAWHANTAAGNEGNRTPQVLDAGLTATNMTRAAGISAGTAGNSFQCTGFPNNRPNGTAAAALAANQFVQFGFTVNASKTASVSAVNMQVRRSSTGPQNWILYYKVGSAADVVVSTGGSNTASSTQSDLVYNVSTSSITALQDIAAGTTVLFKLVAWNASNTSGAWGLGNSTSATDYISSITGTVANAAAAPVITSALTASRTFGAATSTYTITASNTPTGFTATSLPTNATFASPTISFPATVPAGTHNINIGASNASGSDAKVLVLTVAKATPTISFGNITKTYGDAAFDVAATTNSDGAITYSSGTTSVATISGSTVTITGVGTSILTATQVAGTNHNAGSATCTLSVSPKTITLTGASGVSKVYDRTTDASISGGTLNGVIGADVVTANTGTFAQATAGNGIAVSVNLSGANAANYSLTQPGITANITAKTVTITGLSATSRAFDAGNTSAEITGTPSVSADILSPDAVSISGTATGTFANDAVGNSKTVTVSGLSLTGANAANYSLNPLTLTANITAVALTDQTITFNALADKTYGDANFNLSASASSGLTVTYSSSNTSVATISGNTVTIVGAGTTTITASQGGNGSFNPAQNQTQDLQVVQKELTISGISINNKVYDATTDATIAGSASLVGIVGSDVVSASGTPTAIFENKNVANGVSVTVSGYTLSGADAGNYSLAQPSGLTANITPATLTITGVMVTTKQYDANTTAALTGSTLSDILGADVVSLNSASVVANFNNASVGTTKPVSISGFALSGADAGNYSLTQPTGITGNITAKPLTITGLTANNKDFDNTTTATITGTAVLSGGVIGSEVVVLGGTPVATFADAIVGTGKAVTVTGYTISGANAGNYSLTQPNGLTANIIAVDPYTYYNLATNGNYSETFTDISSNASWANAFVNVRSWSSVAVNATGSIPSGTRTQTANNFTSGSSGGYQKGSGTFDLLVTGATNNGASLALDLNLNFTGRNANQLTFDAATIFNSTGNRGSQLKVYWSTDRATWTELTGTNLPYNAVNNVAGSAAVSATLPAAFNNAPKAILRFYIYTSAVGTTGSRPKISLDNIAVSIVPQAGFGLYSQTGGLIGNAIANSSTTNYGSSVQNSTSSRSFFVRNTGGASTTLSISDVSLSGPDASEFEFVGLAGTTFTLAQNAEREIVVRYKRTTVVANTDTATLTITNNNASPAVSPTSYTITLTGENVGNVATPPTVDPVIASGTTNTSVNVSSSALENNAAISERGFIYTADGSEPAFTTGNTPNASTTKVQEGTGAGSFNTTIGSLASNTLHKIKAYATNTEGTGVSTTVSITTFKSAPTTQAANIISSNVLATKASIAITRGNGDSVAVYVNTVNSFTNPSEITILGAANTVYTSGQKLVYKGIGTAFNLTGLTANTQYFVKAFEYNNGSIQSRFNTTDGTDNPKAFTTLSALFAEPFNNLTTNSWTSIYTGAAGNTSASKSWGINITESESGVYATGFDGASNAGNSAETYLVSKSFNLDAWSNESLTIDMRRQFDDAGLLESAQFKVRYTTSYTGNPADAGNNWQDLTFTRPTSQAGTLTPWTSSNIVDISGITGTNVRFVVYYKSSGDGSGSTSNWYADNFNIYGSVTPPTVTLENGYVSPAAMGVGSGNNIIGRVKIKAAINPCTLTSVTVPTTGTYVVGDIATNGFKLRASADSVLTVADATIGTLASVASGSDLVFTGLNNTIAVSDSLWLFITADINEAATPANSVGIAAIPFSNFNFGTVNFVGAGPLAAGPLKVIEVVNPDVTLSGFSTSATNINKGYNNRVLGRVKVEVASANATLTSLSIPTSGTFTSSDISSFRLVYSEDSLFQLTDQVLDTITGVSNGSPIAFTGFSRVFSSGTSTYLFLVANVASNATVSNTFQTNALPVTNFGFGTVDFSSSDDLTSTGLKTIVEPAANVAVQVTGPAAGVSTLASVNEMLYRLKLKASDASSTLSALNLTTTGTYISTDFIDDFKLYVSADSIFNAATDTLLGTATVVETGDQISFTGLTRVIGQDSTRWYFVSNNISAEAGVGRTFGFAATSFAGLSLSNATLTGANPTAASGLKTFDGNSLALYTFDGGAGPATTTANVTFGSFTRVGVTESVLAGAFQSNNLSTSSGGNVVAGQYYQFTVTPAASYQMNLVRLTFNDYRSGSGPLNYAVRSSLDGFTTDIATGSVGSGNLQSINLPSASFATLASAVTFRIFPYGASNAAGNYYVDNVQMYGALKVIPVGATTVINGADAEPTIYSLSNNSEVNAVQVLDFNIADDAENNGVDVTPTRIASIQITAGAGSTVPNWAGVLEGAILEVGAETLVGTIGLNTISFTNISNLNSSQTGYIADNGSKTFKLKVWFKTTMADTLPNTIDGKFFNFVLDDANIIRGAGSSVFADANVALASGAAKIEVTGTQATFKTQPTSVRPNTVQTPAITIAVEDGSGFRDVDFTGNITLTANGGTLSGPAVKSAVKGFATFDTLKYTAVAFGVSLTANTSLGTVVSESFNVVNPTPRTGYFRSNGSGLLSNLNLWEYSADSTTWVPSANLPSDSSISVVISEGSSITAAANVNLKRLSILSNGTLTINSGITVTVRNDTLPAINELVVNGTLTNNGGTLTLATDVSAKFEAASVFNLVRSAGGGTIPTATWHPSSTVIISGGTGAVTIPGGLAQTFGNFTWNQTGQAGNTNLTLAKNTQFAGNLTVASTGNGALRLSGSGESKIIVGGNYIQNAGIVQVNNNGTVNLGDTAIVDTLIVNGAFQLNGGTFTTVANNNRTEVYLNGNVSIGGSATITTSDSLLFVLGGSAATTISNSNTGVSLGKLTVNKSGADSTSRVLNIGSNLSVTDLTLVNGNVVTGENILSITGTLIGEGAGKKVIGRVGTTIAVAARGTTEYTFSNSGLSLSFPDAGSIPSIITVVRITNEAVTGATGAASVKRRYNITAGNNETLNATMKFTFLPEELNGLNATNLNLSRSTNGGATWNTVARVGSVTFAGGLYTVTATGINAFSDWTLEDGNAPLPVTLVAFNGKATQFGNELTWVTASELNNQGFRIERSENGKDFTSIAFVAGKGTTNAKQTYSYSDAFGKAYYRLAQVDLDGKTTLSNVIFIGTESTLKASIAPNPSNGAARLIVSGNDTEVLTLSLISSSGKVLQTLSGTPNQLSDSFYALSNELKSGTYFVKVISANAVETIKFMKR